MSILEDAAQVVNERQVSYGTREDNFGRIAAMWSAILGCEVSAKDVALCMIALKVARLKWGYTRDGAVDICGYAQCLEDLCEQG